jgi:lipid A 4'-phosphatase
MTERPQSDAVADREARRELVAAAGIVGILAAILFAGWPELDLAVSRLFNIGPRNFLFTQSDFVAVLRRAFELVTWAAGIAAIAGIVLALAKGKSLFRLSLKEWVFVALVLITGPGLIANTLLKDNWSRPRPTQVVDFGGQATFKPVLNRGGSCERNCSFISGEASSIFALGFAAAMLARRRRAAWMAGAVISGCVIGLIRIGEGGHFLSDVIFAGVIMALDVALMHRLVFQVVAPRARSEAWWHERSIVALRTFKDWLEDAYIALRGRAAGWKRGDGRKGDDFD